MLALTSKKGVLILLLCQDTSFHPKSSARIKIIFGFLSGNVWRCFSLLRNFFLPSGEFMYVKKTSNVNKLLFEAKYILSNRKICHSLESFYLQPIRRRKGFRLTGSFQTARLLSKLRPARSPSPHEKCKTGQVFNSQTQ